MGRERTLLYFIGVSDNMQVWCIRIALCRLPFWPLLEKMTWYKTKNGHYCGTHYRLNIGNWFDFSCTWESMGLKSRVWWAFCESLAESYTCRVIANFNFPDMTPSNIFPRYCHLPTTHGILVYAQLKSRRECLLPFYPKSKFWLKLVKQKFLCCFSLKR